MEFQFQPATPTIWNGRRPAKQPRGQRFHVKWSGVDWNFCIEWKRDEGTGDCWARRSSDALTLAKAVNSAKRFLGGVQDGGSFLINEFGQVLVPAQDGGGAWALAGHSQGVCRFDNPFEATRPIDLSDPAGLICGHKWDRPYVGIPFNLKRWNQIYFWRQDGNGGASDHPPRQDERLIQLLRKIRPSGPVRFLVNPHGLVLTKKPLNVSIAAEEEDWQPIYVGKIDPKAWFTQEE